MVKSKSKKKYIDATSELLLSSDPDSISARKIANRTGYTAAAIYKNFSCLDELIIYASFHFLSDYHKKFDEIATKYPSALLSYVVTERFFASFSFLYASLFDTLYFASSSVLTHAALNDYASIYPDHITPGSHSTKMLSGGNFLESNRKLLVACIAERTIAIDHRRVDIVNSVIVNLYKGFLKEVLDNPGNIDCEAKAQQYYDCFLEVLSNYFTETGKNLIDNQLTSSLESFQEEYSALLQDYKNKRPSA